MALYDYRGGPDSSPRHCVFAGRSRWQPCPSVHPHLLGCCRRRLLCVFVLVCPVWFIVSGIKTAIQRPPFLIATARLLIPVGVLLLAICNYTVQRQIAKANSATLIQACESYYKDNGKYPDRLDQLVPRYLGSVPMAKYCLSGGFWYFPQQHMFFYEDIPPFGRPVYTFDDKRWGYVD